MSDYPWFKNYPEGIPHEIGPYQYQSLIEMFDSCCDRYADKVAFENYGAKLTFRQLHEHATHFAAYLQGGLGLKKGERIAIQMPNLLQFPVAFFGAIKAGLIAVNTNPLYTAREMKHQFNDSGAKAILILANFAYNLEEILPETKIETVIIKT